MNKSWLHLFSRIFWLCLRENGIPQNRCPDKLRDNAETAMDNTFEAKTNDMHDAGKPCNPKEGQFTFAFPFTQMCVLR